MAKPSAHDRFMAAAADAGIPVEAVRYPEGTRTAADAAAAVGCEVSQIVKSLVVIGPDGPAWPSRPATTGSTSSCCPR